MKIKVDENGYVTGYVIIGGMDEAEEYTGAVPEGFSPGTVSFYHLINGNLVLDADKQYAARNKELLLLELDELINWFEWYDNQVNQYNRSQRLAETSGETFDGDILALDAQAKAKQLRLREIRQVIG